MKSQMLKVASGVLGVLGVLAYPAPAEAAKIEGKLVAGLAGQEICIVDNPAVQQDFRDAYQRRIEAKGYTTRIVQAIGDCPIATTYSASYGQHWGVYLAVSYLQVFRDGAEIGNVRYKVSYANPTKHGRVEDKIGEMVEKLLPMAKPAST